MFVDGGRIPPGVTEVRKSTLTINYVPKSDRAISQRQLELEISRDLADVPDIRFWFLDENGKRNVTLIVTGQDSATVANVATELAAQMQRLPSITNVVSTCEHEPAGAAHLSAPRSRGPAGGLDREPVGNHPRRDHRRRRPRAGQVRRRRPHRADPRPAGGKRARRQGRARADPRAVAARRRRAARRTRRHRVRRRPDQHQPARPAAAGHHRGRPGRQLGAEQRDGGDQGPAGDEEPAGRASRSPRRATPSCRPSCSTASARRCATA